MKKEDKYSRFKFFRNLVCVLRYNNTRTDEFLKLHPINLLYMLISVTRFSMGLLWSGELLLDLASTVILGFASRGVQDHTLLSHESGSRANSVYWFWEYTWSRNVIYSTGIWQYCIHKRGLFSVKFQRSYGLFREQPDLSVEQQFCLLITYFYC